MSVLLRTIYKNCTGNYLNNFKVFWGIVFLTCAHFEVILSFKASDIGLDEGASNFPSQIHLQSLTDDGHH